MKRLSEFLKTTILGGLLVLLPVLLLYLLLDEIFELVMALATPIADLFPKGTFDEINFPVLIAIIMIVLASFLLGITARSESGKKIGQWIDRTILERIPLYNALKRFSRGLVGAKEKTTFKPAVLQSPEGVREIVYVIEEHSDGFLTVLVPWAPASFTGSVKIVNRDRVEMLDASLGDTSMVLSHWGLGARDLLGKQGDK